MSALQVGDKAPIFKGINQDEKEISLSNFSGKNIILYFYPKDNTPGCTVESKNLNENYKKLIDLGFEIIGISPDSVKSHCNFISKHNLQFNLIADTEKEILNLYGAWGKKKMYGREYEGVFRTTFVINKDGIIDAIFTKVNTKDHTNQILAKLDL